MEKKNVEEINSKSLIRFGEVLQLEENLDTAGSNEISRNSFGKRIKVRLFEDDQNLNANDLPWTWPLLPKHLQIMPKVGETVLIFFQNIDGARGNRFYVGPVISQDYYLDNGGIYEAKSLLQGVSTNPLCHPDGNPANNGTHPDKDTIAIQGRGDSTIWLKEEELRLMCGYKPYWRRRSKIEGADPGSMEFNKDGVGDDDWDENKYRRIGYIQLKFDKYKEQNGDRKFGSVINVVADRIHLITHDGSVKDNVNISDQNELMTKADVEKFATNAQRMVYGDELIKFLMRFREVFAQHTHNWYNDPQEMLGKDMDFWGKNLDELLCKTIRIS